MALFTFANSLRARLVFLALAAALPSLCLIAFNAWEDRHDAVAAATKEVVTTNSSMAAVQEALTDSTRQLLDTLGQLPVIQEGDPEKVQAVLKNVLEKTPRYINILAVRPNGDVFAAGKNFTPMNLADRRQIRLALATDGFAAGEYIVGRTVRKAGFPFAAPVHDANGRILSLLVTTVDLEQFQNLFDTARLPDDSVLGMADHQGTRLFFHPQRDTNPVGQPMRSRNFEIARSALPDQAFDISGADGVRRIYSFSPLRLKPGDEPYMYIYVGLPREMVLAKADAVTLRNAALFGVAVLLALAAALWLGERVIGRKFAMLQSFAGRLRNGQLDARSDLAAGGDEFGQLATAFNEMAEGLTQHFRAEKVARRALADSERKLRFVADYTYDWAFWRADDGSIIWMSPSCERVTGYPVESFLSRPSLIEDIIHPADRPDFDAHLVEIRSGVDRPHSMDFRIRHKKGHDVWINHNCVPVFDESGRSMGRRVSNRDITDRKMAEEELRLAAHIFDDSIQGVIITSRDGRIERVNPSFTAITGYEPREVVGLTPRVFKSGRHPASFYAAMWQALLHEGQWSGEIWNRRKSGEIYPEWLSITSIRDERDRTTHFVAIFHDITEVKRHQQALRHQAEHDALTGLPNRTLFDDRLSMAIHQAKRREKGLAVMFIDLDHFKHVNDSLGHATGDMLLLELAKRLSGGMREHDTVARLGGDEFIVLASEIEGAGEAAHLAQRLLDLLRDPFVLGELEFYATASLGIAMYPDDGKAPGELVKNADLAMYKAKALGRNSFQFFDQDMETRAKARLSLESHLQRGLRGQEFEVFYQPLADMRTGRVVGAEALVRWRREDGYVLPGEFIPVAEETGLIIPLGEWVLHTACRDTRAFRQRLLPDMRVAVNFSSRQFGGHDLPDMVKAALAQSELPASALHVEITESVLLTNMNSVVRQLEQLRSLGAVCQLDDFGTGYSSMAYLKRLPIDGLKIDRSFVGDIETNADSLAISTSIVSLAKALGLRLVAEGIESKGQLDILKGLGVDVAQGYLIAKPMPAADFRAFVRENGQAW